MNTSLLVMAGVALLLLSGSFCKGSWIYKWLSLGTAVLLLIQPAVAALKWVGGLVGV